jgi:membrane protein DedA with SNARE-associated domain
LISIPAGLSKMPFGQFLLYTFLGAGIWNTVLAVLGYVAHGQADLINEYSHELSVAILVLLGAVIAFYLIRWLVQRARKKGA